MKKKPPFNQEMAIRGANRRLFARSPLVREKLEQSRQEFPRYKKDGTLAKKPWVKRQCEVCSTWVSSSKIAVDHIDPVVPQDGFPHHFDIWDRTNLFLRRLWCDISNLQRICDDCHDKKTAEERFKRMYSEEVSMLDSATSGTGASDEWFKKFLKKYTPKRLEKYPYPKSFKDRIIALRKHYIKRR